MTDLKNDIERYCNGQMSPEEMHALERRALTDPFLADALEGIGLVTPEQFNEDLAGINKQIDRRTRRTALLWAWSYRAAAALSLLALVTFLVVNDWSGRKEQIARNKGETESLPVAPPAADTVDMGDQTLADRTPIRRRTQPSISKSEQKEDEVFSEIIIPEEVAEPAAPAGRIAVMPKPMSTVKGYVVDAEDGRGLPGVNVTIKGTNIGTITDEEGNYEIAFDSLNSGLVFSFIGFESREIIPTLHQDVNVALNPDIAELSEVVVVGYGVSRDPATMEAPLIEMAVPEGGKKAFKQYLEQNLRYPEQALNNKIEGKVTVQFTIETNGVLSDFQVLRGLGYGCDEEVIRLIKSGPKWSPTKRNHAAVRDKVKVRMRFSLPKK
jgi:TonB family protein